MAANCFNLDLGNEIRYNFTNPSVTDLLEKVPIFRYSHGAPKELLGNNKNVANKQIYTST